MGKLVYRGTLCTVEEASEGFRRSYEIVLHEIPQIDRNHPARFERTAERDANKLISLAQKHPFSKLHARYSEGDAFQQKSQQEAAGALRGVSMVAAGSYPGADSNPEAGFFQTLFNTRKAAAVRVYEALCDV